MRTNSRFHGGCPYSVVIPHGGPSGAGEVTPLTRAVSCRIGDVLEPLQRAHSIEGQVAARRDVLEAQGDVPVAFVGRPWGVWQGCLLVARHPEAVCKLILVGSGPFDASDAAGIRGAREARLSAAERAELCDVFAAGRDAGALARGVALLKKAGAFDPMEDEAVVEFDRAIHGSVWPEASEMRRLGALLEEVS